MDSLIGKSCFAISLYRTLPLMGRSPYICYKLASRKLYPLPSPTNLKLYSQPIWIEKVFAINAFYFAYICVQWIN